MGRFLSTGSSGGSLSHAVNAQLNAIRLVDGSGTMREFRRSDDPDDPFFAAGVSMGLLGIITSVTFQCVPTFNIAGEETTSGYDECAFDQFSPEGEATKPTMAEFFRTAEYGRGMWWPQKRIEKIVVWQAKRSEGEPEEPFPLPYKEFPTVLGSTKPANFAVGVLMRLLDGLNPPGPKTRLGRAFNTVVLRPLFYVAAKLFLGSSSEPFRDTWGSGLPMDNRVDYKWTPTDFSEMWVPVSKTQEAMRALRDHYVASDLSKIGTYSVEI